MSNTIAITSAAVQKKGKTSGLELGKEWLCPSHPSKHVWVQESMELEGGPGGAMFTVDDLEALAARFNDPVYVPHMLI